MKPAKETRCVWCNYPMPNHTPPATCRDCANFSRGYCAGEKAAEDRARKAKRSAKRRIARLRERLQRVANRPWKDRANDAAAALAADDVAAREGSR